MTDAYEAINDHSDALKLLKTHIMSIKGEVDKLTAQSAANDNDLRERLKHFEGTVTKQGAEAEQLGRAVTATDQDLKERLMHFEALVTSQGETINQLKDRLSSSSAAAPLWPGPSLGASSVDASSLDARLTAFESQVESQIKKLDSLG